MKATDGVHACQSLPSAEAVLSARAAPLCALRRVRRAEAVVCGHVRTLAAPLVRAGVACGPGAF